MTTNSIHICQVWEFFVFTIYNLLECPHSVFNHFLVCDGLVFCRLYSIGVFWFVLIWYFCHLCSIVCIVFRLCCVLFDASVSSDTASCLVWEAIKMISSESKVRVNNRLSKSQTSSGCPAAKGGSKCPVLYGHARIPV
jgi:hypothetical protein